MVIDHWGPAPRLKGKGLMSGLFAKKTLLNGTKMFLRMFKTSRILDLGSNKLKVAENVLTLGKVARSCSFAKMLLKIPKVTQNLS